MAQPDFVSADPTRQFEAVVRYATEGRLVIVEAAGDEALYKAAKAPIEKAVQAMRFE